jgi:hypothetical protein
MAQRKLQYLLCFAISIFYVPINVLAGAATANLKCTPLTQGSNMHINGTVPATDDDYQLTISSRENSYTLNSENSTATTVESFKDNVYTLDMRINVDKASAAESLVLYAIPKTLKLKESSSGKTLATFTASLTALRPSKWNSPVKTYDDYVHDIKLSCLYDYQI